MFIVEQRYIKYLTFTFYLYFYLLTPKPKQFILITRHTSGKFTDNPSTYTRDIVEKTSQMDTQTPWQMKARRTLKHNASITA